jgi:flagellar export protein FliJ
MAEPRFIFRAAAALELRRRRDQAAQDALGAANAALQRAEDALTAARGALSAACERPRNAGSEAEWYRNWMIGLRAAIVRRTGELAGHRRVRDQALADAIGARRALRAIERLRDRRLRAFELESARREQRRIDELGVQRYQAGKIASGGTS